MREPLAARKAPARAKRPRRSRPGCCTDSGGRRTHMRTANLRDAAAGPLLADRGLRMMEQLRANSVAMSTARCALTKSGFANPVAS